MEQQVKEFESCDKQRNQKIEYVERPKDYVRHIEMKARERGVPLHGMFELTPLCNFDCKMCYVHLSPEQMGRRQLLTVEQWKCLIKQAVENGMIDATLTGGECLTYPGFDAIYRYLVDLGIKTNLITNGLLLDEKRICQFREYHSAVQVSIYGTSDDAYERVTGRRVFHQVISNLMQAKEAGLHVKATITPSRHMGSDDEKLIGLLISLDIPFSINANLFEARAETGRKLDEFDQSLEDYIRLRRLYMRHRGITVSEECLTASPGLPPSGMKCGGGNSGFVIDWKGNMLACAMLPDIMAKPLETGFVSAWEIIHAAAQVYPNPTECRECKFNQICTSCVAVHRNGAAEGHANKRICQLAQLIIKSEMERV